jgi:hypothetical protein
VTRIVKYFVFLILICAADVNSQVINHIKNGGFENLYDCAGLSINKVISWSSIDSIGYGGNFYGFCNNKVPLSSATYQFPRNGSVFAVSTLYWPNSSTYSRGYLKNRMVANLQQGKTYCVKFHVNVTNTSPYGIDGFGVYFGDNSIDTIKYYNVPLNYLNPQVKNTPSNVIIDTLNWVLVTGTFVATGMEKYALLGNFLADNAVTTASIGGPYYPQKWTDVCIDEVSCIELNLPAFAGRDTAFAPGDSIFLGRVPDVGINEACIWYKLPGTVPFDTIAGFWLKPSETCTYVVRQEICGLVKWDTVILHLNMVGFKNFGSLRDGISLSPVPAMDFVNLTLRYGSFAHDITFVEIYDQLGSLLWGDVPRFVEGTMTIRTEELPAGIYFLRLAGKEATMCRKIVISR